MIINNFRHLIQTILELDQREFVVFIHDPDAVPHTIAVQTIGIGHDYFIISSNFNFIKGYNL